MKRVYEHKVYNVRVTCKNLALVKGDNFLVAQIGQLYTGQQIFKFHFSTALGNLVECTSQRLRNATK